MFYPRKSVPLSAESVITLWARHARAKAAPVASSKNLALLFGPSFLEPTFQFVDALTAGAVAGLATLNTTAIAFSDE